MPHKIAPSRLELKGLGISSGVGFGRARVMAGSSLQLPQYGIEKDSISLELDRFDKARNSVNRDISNMMKRTPKRAPKEVKSFLEMFRQLVNDEMLRAGVERIIRSKLINVEWALIQYLEEIKKVFEKLPDSYLSERGYDIEHVVDRLQEELQGRSNQLRDTVHEEGDEVILVTSDLSLADVIWLTEYEELDLVGIITEKGGVTSHTAVLSQTLFIPAIVGISGAREQIKNGQEVFIDSFSGTVVCNPTEEEKRDILTQVEEQEKQYSRYYRARRRVAETIDHHRLQLFANVAMCTGLEEVLHQGAQGVGLFRSEYLFLGRDGLPDENEQFEQYSSLIKTMGNRPVTIRTLDVGGDKILNQEARKNEVLLKDDNPKEDNPALGQRAIRFSLANPDFFLIQIRAILRASVKGNVRILLPMISCVEEIREAKKYIEIAKKQLKMRGDACKEDIPIGIMIELPGVAFRPTPFLKEVDFASIGTNDLIQYTLGVDRGNPTVAPLYEPYHASVLGLIANVIRHANRLNKPVSICGEMGGQPELTPFFVGLGIKELSMAAMQIPQVKEVVRSVSKKDCERLAKKILSISDTTTIKKVIKKFVEGCKYE